MAYEIITLLLSIITTGAVIGGAGFGVSQLRGVQRQLKVTVFTTYTERYSRILEKLPQDGDEAERSAIQGALASKYVTPIRQFLDLCSEEYYLNSQKLLDKQVWELWKKGILFHLQTKLFRDIWENVKNKEGYAPEFVVFIDGLIKQKLPT